MTLQSTGADVEARGQRWHPYPPVPATICYHPRYAAKLSQHSADAWNLIFSIQPLPLPSDPSQSLWFVHDHGAL